MGVVVFTSFRVIKCTPVIKLEIKYTLLIHKVVCMVQPNEFNREMYTVIKVWVTEAEARVCFPGLVSHHQSGLQKTEVLSRGLWWSAGSSLGCCTERLPFCFRKVCRAAFLQLGTLASVLDYFFLIFFFFWWNISGINLFWKTTAQCWFQNQNRRKTRLVFLKGLTFKWNICILF